MKKTLILSLLIAIPFVSFGAARAGGGARAGSVRSNTVRTITPRPSTPRPSTPQPVRTVQPTKQVVQNTTASSVTSYNPFSSNFFLWYFLFAASGNKAMTATSTQLKK